VSDEGLVNPSLLKVQSGDIGNYIRKPLANYETCVSFDTKIQLKRGCFYIGHCVGKEVEVWNGEEWSTVVPFKAKDEDEFMRISFSDGSSLKVTPYHEFSVSEDQGKTWQKMRSDQLLEGMEMPRFELPRVRLPSQVIDESQIVAWTNETLYERRDINPKVFGLSTIDLETYLDLLTTGSHVYYDTSLSLLQEIQLLYRRIGKTAIIRPVGSVSNTKTTYKLEVTPEYCRQYITNVEILEEREPSYCFSEPKRTMGVFGNVLTHQCCLGELYLPNIKSYEELKKCAKYSYTLCKHSLRLPCKDSKRTEEVVHKNMRMGIGVTGYLQATEEQRGWLKDCYEYLRGYDKMYSEMMGWPTSVKLTTCKPSGTLSLLGGTTSGVHPAFAQYYIRRIRLSSQSPLVEVAKRNGYHVEPVRNFDGTNDRSTMVVSFPHKVPEGTILAKDCTAVDQLEWVKRLQTEWSDNAVSCCLTEGHMIYNVDPETGDGTMRDISDYVNSKDLKSGLYTPQDFLTVGEKGTVEQVNQSYYNGVARTVKVTLESGNTIQGTEDHKVLCVTKDKDEEWIKLGDLSSNDNPLVVLGANQWVKDSGEAWSGTEGFTNVTRGQAMTRQEAVQRLVNEGRNTLYHLKDPMGVLLILQNLGVDAVLRETLNGDELYVHIPYNDFNAVCLTTLCITVKRNFLPSKIG
jgi:hypothetical protein